MKILLILLVVLLVLGLIKLIAPITRIIALRAYADGDEKKAIALYENIIKIASKNVRYKSEYSLLLMRIGKYKEAEIMLTEIICDRTIPQKEKINVYSYRAMAYHKLGRTEEAIESMEEVFGNYKNTIVYGMLGYLKLLSGDAELEFCKEAYEYNSDDRDISDNMVVSYTRLGEYEKAEEIAKKLVEKYPQYVEGFYHFAELSVKMGNYKKAKELADRIDDCRYSMITTVSKEEINALKEEVKNA